MIPIAAKELSIILVGSFNPAILNSQWLARKNIIPERIADSPDIKINAPQVSEFSVDSRKYLILLNRFSVSTMREELFETTIREVISTFKILSETPIHQMGINWIRHYKFPTVEDYKKFGHILVPKDDLWNRVAKEPGLKSIMIQSNRADNHSGKMFISAATSRHQNMMPAIEIQVNDHYDFAQQNESIGAEKALNILEKEWEISRNNADKIMDDIFSYGTNSNQK